MPPKAFGKLNIICSSDIGKLGPNRSTAAVYNWKWYYNKPSITLWLILIASFIFIEANRNTQALLIIVPLLMLNLLWLAFKKAMDLGSAEVEMPNMVFNSLAVGITVLWLFAHKLGNSNRFVTFILAFTLMVMLGLVGTASYVGLEFPLQTGRILILLAILFLAMLLGFVLAGWQCRNSYSGLRFVLYLAFYTVAVCLVGTLVLYSVAFSIDQIPIPISTVLFLALVVGLILGGCLYVISLPYMILALRSSLFRERFYACMRLKSMPMTYRQADADHLDEQDSGPGTSEN